MAVEGVGQRCLDVLVCAYWRAQDLESLLDWGERPVSNPNRVSVLWLKVLDVRRLLTRLVPHPCFCGVELDTRVVPQGFGQGVIQWPDAVGVGEYVHVVKICEHGFSIFQLGLEGSQCRVLCEAIQGRHQGVALFPALGLPYAMGSPGLICPCVRAGPPVPLLGVSVQGCQVGMSRQPSQHCSSRHMVICSDRVQGQYCCSIGSTWVAA